MTSTWQDDRSVRKAKATLNATTKRPVQLLDRPFSDMLEQLSSLTTLLTVNCHLLLLLLESLLVALLELRLLAWLCGMRQKLCTNLLIVNRTTDDEHDKHGQDLRYEVLVAQT